MLDVLVETQQVNSSTATIYFGDRTQFTSNMRLTPAPDVQYQLLLMDYNMDLKPDFFGIYNDERTFWVQQEDGSYSTVSFPNTDNMTLNPISQPNSNAFVDIDGDCLADLVLFSHNDTASYMEIWTLGGTTAHLVKIIQLPEGAGQVTFADIDRDGTTDFVFPVCGPDSTCSGTNSIVIVYNVQENMCTSIAGGGDNCVDSSDICGVQQAFTFPDVIPTTSTSGVVVIEKEAFNGNTFFWEYILSNKVPNTLRLGDYDADGYPDLLVVLERANGTSTIQVWNSIECTEALCGSDATGEGRRTFQYTPIAAVDTVQYPYAGTFFDFGDDGTLDVIVLADGSKNKIGGLEIITIENAVNYGTYFLKTIGLSGLCMQWCDGDIRFPDPKPIGVNQPGAVFKYIWSDNDQDKRVTTGKLKNYINFIFISFN